MAAIWLNGFLASLALIVAIGAQNAFVLKQGLLRQHVLAVVLACALSDALLISAGVAGFGALVKLYPLLPSGMAAAGAGFLGFYGVQKLLAAWRGGEALTAGNGGQSFRRTVLTVLGLTWLNPHVYLDTLGLLGALSVRFTATAEKAVFAFGAISASFLFFFALGYGARLLAPLMRKPGAWRVLDLLIGGLMLILAFQLFREI